MSGTRSRRCGVRNGSGVKLKGLKRYTSNGNDYIYHRKTGICLGVNISEDDPNFLAAYLDAENSGKPQPKLEQIKKDSVADVCQRFMSPRKYRDLSQGYQDNLRRDAQRLCAEADNKLGKVNFCSVSQAHIESQLGKMERNPGNQRLKLWRYLTDFAFQNRIVAHKATDGIKANPEKKTAGHIPWTFEDITKFRERWPYGTRQRLAFELQFWAGARISDTRNLGPKNIDDQGWLNFVQQKTGSEVSVPMYRALPHFAETADLDQTISAIDAMPVGDLTWLATESGEVRSQKGGARNGSRARHSKLA